MEKTERVISVFAEPRASSQISVDSCEAFALLFKAKCITRKGIVDSVTQFSPTHFVPRPIL